MTIQNIKKIVKRAYVGTTWVLLWMVTLSFLGIDALVASQVYEYRPHGQNLAASSPFRKTGQEALVNEALDNAMTKINEVKNKRVGSTLKGAIENLKKLAGIIGVKLNGLNFETRYQNIDS